MARIVLPAEPVLELRDLRLVVALDAAGTTARASELLHLSQSAVSRALVALEEQLGTKLFERTPRGLSATTAGAHLVARASPMLEAASELVREVRERPAAPRRIRVVAECYTAYHWLPTALLELRGLHPELRVDVALEHTRDPAAGLVSGEVDLAIVTTAEVEKGTFEQRRLFSDEIVFVLAADHPLAKKRALEVEDLASHLLITSPVPAAESRWFLASVFGRARPVLRFERLPLTEAILDFARSGAGIGILSEWIAGPHLLRGDLVARRLSKGPLERPWRIVHRPEIRPIGRVIEAALRATSPRNDERISRTK